MNPPPNEQPFYAGIFGVFCSGCNELVVAKSGNKLHVPSRRTLKRYLSKHTCSTSTTPHPSNWNGIEKELTRSQQAIRKKAATDPHFAQAKINALFPNGCYSTKSSVYYCSNCGYSTSRKEEISGHFGKKNRRSFGCQQTDHSRQGDVMFGPGGLKCPKEIIDGARRGDFPTAFLDVTASSAVKRRRLNDTATASVTQVQQTNALQVPETAGGTLPLCFYSLSYTI